jgi:putative ABC transport system permease protein
MKALDRLLISDLRQMWGQALAISAMLACGIATFVMATNTMRSLDSTRSDYYRRYRFADVFVPLVRAPNQLAARLAEIPGVAHVQTRVVRDVILDVPGMLEPASCRLVSTPRDPVNGLNGIHLQRGRLPNPSGRNEVLASEVFANAHGWKLGDSIRVIMGGRREQLQIVGMAMSPEYVYAVPPGQMLADNRRFGVVWMPYRQMAAAFNMEGAFNNATLALLPRASIRDVIFHVDRLTESYGSRGAFDRTEQTSDRFLDDELHQLKSMALVTPSIFLGVSVFLFNLVFTRMVRQQQEQIATLRAFGYRQWQIAWYYTRLVLILVAIGSVVGFSAGIWLSNWMTSEYARFFRFPIVHYEFARDQAVIAVAICLVAAFMGSFSALRRAVRLQPAVAMRPEAPRTSGKSLLERLGLQSMLSPIARMILRRLERNPRSTLLSILGMSLGVAVLIVGTFLEDTIDFVMDVQFQRAQRQDVMLTFNETLSTDALHDVQNLPGVSFAEPFRAVPVRVRNGNRQRRLSLMALEERTRLFRVLDENQNQVELIGSGITISQKLAEVLELQIGDNAIVELMEGRRGRHLMRVAAVFPDYTDPGAYVNRAELQRMLGESDLYSGAFLLVDPDQLQELYTTLQQTPTIAGVTSRHAAIQNFNDTLAENLRPMRITNAIFGFIISFGVIYSCALITLAERSRDMATLRVMGFTRWEVSTVLLGELAIITLAAIPVGLPIGAAFAWIATVALDTETHRFPFVMSRATMAYASVVIIVSAFVSALIVRRMLDKLDLIAVLKVKE